MRKWIFAVLAVAGTALIATPSAMAQSEWGTEEDDQIWDEFGEPEYFSPPMGTQLYGYRTLGVVTPPGVTPQTRVYRYSAPAPAPAPGLSYFSPPRTAPGGTVETEVQVGPGPGECGTNFYWSEAAGRCVDARTR
jgi:hypothetical protein